MRGRPCKENKKDYFIKIRVNAEELEKINNYWFLKGTKAKVI